MAQHVLNLFWTHKDECTTAVRGSHTKPWPASRNISSTGDFCFASGPLLTPAFSTFMDMGHLQLVHFGMYT